MHHNSLVKAVYCYMRAGVGECFGGEEYSPNPGDSVTSVVVKNGVLVERDTVM